MQAKIVSSGLNSGETRKETATEKLLFISFNSVTIPVPFPASSTTNFRVKSFGISSGIVRWILSL
ncbi:hypothetical protein D9M72_636260 [compost metagenome]